MPTLQESTSADMSGYEPVESPVTSLTGFAPSSNADPGQSVYMRTTLPPVWQTPADSLRTYFNGGAVPQNRLITPTAPPIITQTVNKITQNITQAVSKGSDGFSGIMGQSGYIVFPFPERQPLILQWGLTPTPTSSGVQGTIGYDIDFPNALFGINMTSIQVAGQHTSVPSPVQGMTGTSGFQWTIGTGTDNDGLCPAFWWAWGN